MAKDNFPLISIITINYNQLQVTCELLKSLTKQQYPNFEVIVVDNASNVNPTETIHSIYPNAKIILSAQNKGFAGGNNLGIIEAKGDYLFFVNNDTELADNCIERMLEIFYKYPDAGAVSPKFHYYFHPNVIEYAGYTAVNPVTGRNKTIGGKEIDKGQYNKIRETNYCHGGGMMVPRSVIDKVGMMPEHFFLYYEELDWCTQIKNNGFKIYFQPHALIYHKESMSIGKMNEMKTFYLIRNRILFMRRNYNNFQFYLFILYLVLVAIPKNTFSYLLNKDIKHLKAFMRGVIWNLKNNTSFKKID